MRAENHGSQQSEISDAAGGEPVYLGLEIGELGAWMRLVGGANAPDRQWRWRFTTSPTVDEFLQQLSDGAHSVADTAEILGVGVVPWQRHLAIEGRAGQENQPDSWGGAEFAGRISNALNAPVRIKPAVDAAAVAEARRGAGRDTASFLYVHLGREVRSSLVWNGTLVSAAHGFGGQLGHWRVASDGPRCWCGEVGHLNPLCSSQSMVRLAIGLASQDDNALAAVHAATGGRAEALTPAQVVTLAGQGVGPLRDLVQRAAESLGMAIGSLCLTIDPEIVIIGGPLGVAGGIFLDWTRERVRETLRSSRPESAQPQIIPAELEPQSAAIGAWVLASDGDVG